MNAMVRFFPSSLQKSVLTSSCSYVQAGRVPTLDQIVSTYLTTTAGARDAIIAQAKALAAEVQGGKLDKTAASYYVKVMEKLETSSDWAVKELARLQKMASKKGSLAGKQLEDLQVSLCVFSSVLRVSAHKLTHRALVVLSGPTKHPASLHSC